ncbi:MAG: hypothetical protein QOD40_3174 [Alphaproteobacteria bacterium]|nr:hypothetical protein [Alphaproteobacteria bacterium]
MKKLALAFAAAAVTIAFAAPASAEEVKLRVGEAHHARAQARHVTIVHRDRGMHRGWEHQRERHAAKKVIIKHRY